MLDLGRVVLPITGPINPADNGTSYLGCCSYLCASKTKQLMHVFLLLQALLAMTSFMSTPAA